MQEPLVQHQRPVPGIQDHTLDIIGSQRHAEQLLHIREKSGPVSYTHLTLPTKA